MSEKTYTQTEVDALIAAEREAALAVAKDQNNHLANGCADTPDGFYGVALCVEALQALLPTDQPSALDDALAAAKAEGMKRACELCEDGKLGQIRAEIQALLPTDERLFSHK